MLSFDTDILNKLPILEVASRLGIQVSKKTSKCFLHEEKSPSLKFNTTKNFWKCFGCEAKGSVIDLVLKYHNWSFMESCLWLCNEFGILPRSNYRLTSRQKNIIKENDYVQIMCSPDIEVYNWITNKLQMGNEGKDFLYHKRGYPEDVIKKLKIKYINNSKDFFKILVEFWGIDRLLRCGIVREYVSSKGENFFGLIWWDKTVLFPFYNNEEDVVYLQGRSLEPSTKIRYINLNNVNTAIFNIQVLSKLQVGEKVIITEGVTDCISCMSMGYKSVGIIGASSFKKEYAHLFINYIPVVMPDNDSAGKMFSNKIREALFEIGKELIVIPIDQRYKDISEYYMNEFMIHE
jgi:DNA primase